MKYTAVFGHPTRRSKSEKPHKQAIFVCLYPVAPEQKARTTYDNILRLADDPDVKDVIRFLRERELVHYQRFGESLRLALDNLDSKNFYAFNPSFDKKQAKAALSARRGRR